MLDWLFGASVIPSPEDELELAETAQVAQALLDAIPESVVKVGLKVVAGRKLGRREAARLARFRSSRLCRNLAQKWAIYQEGR